MAWLAVVVTTAAPAACALSGAGLEADSTEPSTIGDASVAIPVILEDATPPTPDATAATPVDAGESERESGRMALADVVDDEARARESAGDAAEEGLDVVLEDGGVEASAPDSADGPAPVLPLFVQGSYATPQTPQTGLSVTYPAPQSPGDLNVVVVGWNDTSALVTSITDTAGNSYALAIGPSLFPGFISQSIYYATNIAGAAMNTITVQFDSPALFPDVRVLEYGGVATTDPVDVATGLVGNSATASAGPMKTTSPDLVVAATTVWTVTTGAGDGFTARILTVPNGDLAADRLATAGPFAATAPLSAPGQWAMQLVAFRAQYPF